MDKQRKSCAISTSVMISIIYLGQVVADWQSRVEIIEYPAQFDEAAYAGLAHYPCEKHDFNMELSRENNDYGVIVWWQDISALMEESPSSVIPSYYLDINSFVISESDVNVELEEFSKIVLVSSHQDIDKTDFWDWHTDRPYSVIAITGVVTSAVLLNVLSGGGRKELPSTSIPTTIIPATSIPVKIIQNPEPQTLPPESPPDMPKASEITYINIEQDKKSLHSDIDIENYASDVALMNMSNSFDGYIIENTSSDKSFILYEFDKDKNDWVQSSKFKVDPDGVREYTLNLLYSESLDKISVIDISSDELSNTHGFHNLNGSQVVDYSDQAGYEKYENMAMELSTHPYGFFNYLDNEWLYFHNDYKHGSSDYLQNFTDTYIYDYPYEINIKSSEPLMLGYMDFNGDGDSDVILRANNDDLLIYDVKIDKEWFLLDELLAVFNPKDWTWDATSHIALAECEGVGGSLSMVGGDDVFIYQYDEGSHEPGGKFKAYKLENNSVTSLLTVKSKGECDYFAGVDGKNLYLYKSDSSGQYHEQWFATFEGDVNILQMQIDKEIIADDSYDGFGSLNVYNYVISEQEDRFHWQGLEVDPTDFSDSTLNYYGFTI